MPAVILGIETSCDETAAAVMRNGELLSSIVATQDIHKKYGGVVPELASRAHQSAIVQVTEMAIEEAGLSLPELDGIAYTLGPGLLGALMVGATYAKGLAMALDIPIFPVHHMQAHIHAHFIEQPSPQYPFLCLTVSGGHTQIVKVDAPFKMEILGKTLDDAAGEAYDKAAKMLGLPYPGGPLIDKYAAKGNENRFKFPEPNVHGLDFSFSGLKTSFMYFINKEKSTNPKFIEENLNDLCASIQHTINNVLLKKMSHAVESTGIKTISIAGGVSANSNLRSVFEQAAKHNNWGLYIPSFKYCTDNAAMIAMSGSFAAKYGMEGSLSDQPSAKMDFIVA